jgi:hypothetical protein
VAGHRSAQHGRPVVAAGCVEHDSKAPIDPVDRRRSVKSIAQPNEDKS